MKIHCIKQSKDLGSNRDGIILESDFHVLFGHFLLQLGVLSRQLLNLPRQLDDLARVLSRGRVETDRTKTSHTVRLLWS